MGNWTQGLDPKVHGPGPMDAWTEPIEQRVQSSPLVNFFYFFWQIRSVLYILLCADLLYHILAKSRGYRTGLVNRSELSQLREPLPGLAY